MYDDRSPGEIFIKMAKEGSTLSGILDGFALSVSIGLQYGVPLKSLVDKLINTRFEPSGYTGHPDIPYAKSLLDYIARWLGGRFISPDYLTHNGAAADATAQIAAPAAEAAASDDPSAARVSAATSSRPTAGYDGAPTCSECGMLMTPNGACYKCENCGGTSGCS
jgi:ribonucleoside-diphosphate reductase alpha chain